MCQDEIINLVGIEPKMCCSSIKDQNHPNSKGSEVCSNDKSQKILETVLKINDQCDEPSNNDGDNVNATTKTPSEACSRERKDVHLKHVRLNIKVRAQ